MSQDSLCNVSSFDKGNFPNPLTIKAFELYTYTRSYNVQVGQSSLMVVLALYQLLNIILP